MTRKRFTEKQVIATLLHQGVEIRCYRTKELVTLQNVKDIQREHLTPFAIDPTKDVPEFCRYSFSEPHKKQTNHPRGPHTTIDSDRHSIDKIEACQKKMNVNKREPGEAKPTTRWTGRPFPKSQRKMQSRPFARKAAGSSLGMSPTHGKE